MKFFSAATYYISSIPTLLFQSNAILTPLLLFQKKILIKLNNQMSFYVSNCMDIWTLKEVILDKQYERFVKIPKVGTIIDIGGAIGEFALYAEKNNNHVFAYEIDEERIRLFEKNLSLNQTKNVVLHHTKATSLDKVFQENNIKHCDLLKIDCEGDEYPIFRNTSDQTLRQIDTITMEYHLFNNQMKKEFKNLIKRFKKFYKVYHFSNQVHDYIGYLACHKK